MTLSLLTSGSNTRSVESVENENGRPTPVEYKINEQLFGFFSSTDTYKVVTSSMENQRKPV